MGVFELEVTADDLVDETEVEDLVFPFPACENSADFLPTLPPLVVCLLEVVVVAGGCGLPLLGAILLPLEWSPEVAGTNLDTAFS